MFAGVDTGEWFRDGSCAAVAGRRITRWTAASHRQTPMEQSHRHAQDP